jgi:hypothetical protein
MKTTLRWAAMPLALLSATIATAAQPCMPGCNGQCRHQQTGDCEAEFWENQLWPEQYIGPARRGICQSFDVMTRNGWRRHNLLGPAHFDRTGMELSEAGRLKVQWILTQSPPNHRTVFIERSRDPQQTAARLESVQALAANLSTDAADVQETDIRDWGRPASTVDAVFTGFSANQRVPMLPPSSTVGGAVGSSAAPSP